MKILIILSILFFLFGVVFYIIAYSRQIDNSKLQKEYDDLIQDYSNVKYDFDILTNKYNTTRANYNDIKNDYNFLVEQGTRLEAELKEKQNNVNNFLEIEKQKIQTQLEIFKTNSNYAMQNYITSMEENYNNADKIFDERINKLQQEYNHIVAEIDVLRATLAAATEARIREEEKNDNLGFYMLQVTDIELDDIKKLDSIKPMLHNPVILSKLIWSTYYQKLYKALCSRVLGEDTVCGIYKITDITTEQYYIGQSVNYRPMKNFSRLLAGVI